MRSHFVDHLFLTKEKIKHLANYFFSQLVGTFFIKASTYEFMKFNQLSGTENFFYSFEYYGDHSLWNFLFPGEQPPIPRGVTHGDELLYLFSTGVFNFQDNDWEMARIMTNLWANFVIYG